MSKVLIAVPTFENITPDTYKALWDMDKGEHEVLFLGNDEALSIRHRAFSKDVFANGALRAALFLAGKPAGEYEMQDLVNELL